MRSILILACGAVLAACGPASDPGPEAPLAAAEASSSELAESIGMTFVAIPAGTFRLGSPDDEAHRQENEGPQRQISISAFEIARTEVTNAQFRAFVDATGYVTEAERDLDGGFGIDWETGKPYQDPDADWRAPGFPGLEPQDDHPVVMISWDDAEAFCRWLTGTTGRTHRLPTEAEFEYVHRAGTTTPWATGAEAASLAGKANVADASLRVAMPAGEWAAEWDDGYPFVAPVGSFEPNPWGLHDVTGNVWEWCSDWFRSDAYETAAETDPTGPDSGGFRTIRGGGWFNPPHQARAAQRIYFHPSFRYCLLSGFRVVREVE